MARDTSKLVTIPGELHSAATGNIVSASQEIFDYDSNSYQSQLNKQLYNVSAHDSSADAKYTLEEAIAAVPASYHVGGLILTFISKEGDFEIYQLKSKDWDADTSKWSIVPNNVVQDNPEFVEVHLDGSEKILYGVRADGDFYFGAGVPSQVKGYVDEKSAEIDGKIEDLKEEIDSSINVNIEKIENEIAVLDASTKADIARLDASVSTGFDRVDASIAALDSSIHALGYYEENQEFVEAHLDSSSKILYGVKRDDGDFYFGGGVPSQVKAYVDEKGAEIDRNIDELKEDIDSSINENIEKIAALDASVNKNIEDIAALDTSVYNLGYYEDNPEYAEVHLDASSRVLYGVKRDDGDFYFGGGVPSQVKAYVDEKGAELDASVNKNIEDIAALDTSVYNLGYYEDNPEYAEVHLDASSRVLYGVKRDDGDFYFGGGVPSQIMDYVNEKGEKIDASILDIETRFYNVNAHDGSIGINYTLEEAIAAVPEEYRNGGLILTFNSDGMIVLYQCKIEGFSETPSDWIQYTNKKYVDGLIENIDSSISSIKYNLKTVESKTFDITSENYIDDDESIILATDDNTITTTIKTEKSLIEDEVIEFGNEYNTETYAKIGSIDGSSGLFVDNIYDLNGNPLIQIDSSNDILILAGKKYKMIPYIEET